MKILPLSLLVTGALLALAMAQACAETTAPASADQKAERDAAVQADEAIVQVPQPRFGNTRTTQSLILKSGQRFLLAVHKLGDSPNQVELCLVHAIFAKVE